MYQLPQDDCKMYVLQSEKGFNFYNQFSLPFDFISKNHSQIQDHPDFLPFYLWGIL